MSDADIKASGFNPTNKELGGSHLSLDLDKVMHI
jgi:hypothetical protein